MTKLSHKRLVDRLMQAYVTWREACLRVSDAYGSWGNGVGPDATFGFVAYMAALDQEELAAEVYAGLMRGAGQLVSGETDRVRAGSQAG